MTRACLIVTLVVASQACATSQATPTPTASPPARATPDRGSPALVHTTSAVLDDVQIVVPCRDAGAVGVIGLGQIGPPEGDAPTLHNWLDALDRRVRRALGAHVVGVGWGEACAAGAVGARVYVDHYARFDDVVASLVALVQREHLRLQFVVLIQPDATPL